MNTKARSRRQRGNAAVETGLIFLPLSLLILGGFEVARGMWMYHTLTTAVKSGARFAIVHGADCLAATATCTSTVAAIANTIQTAGVGLDARSVQLTLTSGAGAYACGNLSGCAGDSTQWPPAGDNAAGLPITLSATYAFHSVLASFWPGQGSASINYLAKSTEIIQF
jgi:Flp pilus assembly protein TadG